MPSADSHVDAITRPRDGVLVIGEALIDIVAHPERGRCGGACRRIPGQRRARARSARQPGAAAHGARTRRTRRADRAAPHRLRGCRRPAILDAGPHLDRPGDHPRRRGRDVRLRHHLDARRHPRADHRESGARRLDRGVPSARRGRRPSPGRARSRRRDHLVRPEHPPCPDRGPAERDRPRRVDRRKVRHRQAER